MTVCLWTLGVLLIATAGVQPQGGPPGSLTTVEGTSTLRHVLSAGTEVLMTSTADLSSKTARQGQRFDLSVAQDVRVNGLLVIPKGTRGVGEVARVVEKGMMGKGGKLEVRVLFVEVGGRRIRLDGKSVDKGASGTGSAAVAAVLVGPLGGFVTGKNAVIPAGTTFTGYVYEDLPLRAAE